MNKNVRFILEEVLGDSATHIHARRWKRAIEELIDLSTEYWREQVVINHPTAQQEE